MPLLPCPECKTEVSDKAATCPKCGCPIAGTTATTSNNPALVTNRWIFWSWVPVALWPIFWLLIPWPSGTVEGITVLDRSLALRAVQRAEHRAIVILCVGAVVYLIVRGIFLALDRRHVREHLPDKAPSLWVALLLPGVVYLDYRRRAVGHSRWTAVAEFAVVWALPIGYWLVSTIIGAVPK